MVKRRINNVWGLVFIEQSLIQDLKDVGVKIIICDNSRLVEKYDFILKYDDKWLDLVVDVCDIECYDFFNKVVDLLEIDLIVSRKRKRIYKERRLVKERIRIDNLRKLKEFLFDLEVEKIVKMIVKKLNEFKDYFFGRKVNILLYIYYVNILGYNCIFVIVTIYCF